MLQVTRLSVNSNNVSEKNLRYNQIITIYYIKIQSNYNYYEIMKIGLYLFLDCVVIWKIDM